MIAGEVQILNFVAWQSKRQFAARHAAHAPLHIYTRHVRFVICCFVFVCLRAPTQSGRSYLKRFERRGCCAKAFALLCVCVCVCEFLIMMCMTCWRFGNQEHVNADACTHARAMQASRGPSGWIDITSFRWAPRGTTIATTDRRQFTCFSNSATGGLANPGTS